jgi:hypothetical protein
MNDELHITPDERARVQAMADRLNRLHAEIDRRLHAGQLEGIDDLEHEAGALAERLDAVFEELETLETTPGDIETTGLPGIHPAHDNEGLAGLEEELVILYAQYLRGDFRGDPWERGQTREDMLADVIRHVIPGRILAHGGQWVDVSRLTPEQLIGAARDAYEHRRALLARYRASDKPPPKLPNPRRTPRVDTYQEDGPWATPAYLAIPGWLRLQGVSDQGIVPPPPCRCDEFPCPRHCSEGYWEHRVDVHRGHKIAERYLLDHGYRPRRWWQDAEGVLVDRWVKLLMKKAIRGANRATRARDLARRRRRP